MGRKRKGSVIGDIGKMWVNTIASPLEALTGQNFVDFKYTSDFGKGASKVVEPLTKGISGAMMAMGTTALNALAPGAGTALSGMGQGLGQGMKPTSNSIQQPPMQMSNKTRPTSGINSVPYGVQEGMPKTGYRNGGPIDSVKNVKKSAKSKKEITYRGENLPEITVEAESPEWIKIANEYEKNNPKNKYIEEHPKRYMGLKYSNKQIEKNYEDQKMKYVAEELANRRINQTISENIKNEINLEKPAFPKFSDYERQIIKKHADLQTQRNAFTEDFYALNQEGLFDKTYPTPMDKAKALAAFAAIGPGKVLSSIGNIAGAGLDVYSGNYGDAALGVAVEPLKAIRAGQVYLNAPRPINKQALNAAEMFSKFYNIKNLLPQKQEIEQDNVSENKYRHGGMLKTYNAPTHENGGQMIDQNANPTNNPNKAVGEIEKKETSWNGYVFSDTLGEGKKTFAQMSKEIVNRYKGKRDSLSKKTMERELMLLIQKNEAARLEKEQMEMQQMQNQFTEEELATLQNPQSPSKEQLDMLFAQQQQQQQGQPSQEQMMQMMQQQQMQQQGQPSEEEMMMMQQMQQQGAPQDMGQYRWGGNMDVPMYQYQNGGMLEVPEAPLDEYKKGGWIQKVTKSIKKRGTEGVCTGDKFGGPSCPPGSKRYNLAKTFRAMAKHEEGGFIDSFPDLNLANYREGGTIQKYPNGGMMAPEWMESAQWPYRIKEKDKRDDVIKNFYYGIIDDLQNPQAARQTLKDINQYYGTDRLEGLGKEIGPYFGFDYNDINDKDLDRWTNEYMEQRGFNKKPTSGEYKNGGMIKRADGSYSKRGLWDNIRDNIGSGKKPTKEMLEQERKIKAQEEYRDGGYVVKRSNERKGKTHVVIGPDGTKKYFGDPDLKNNPSEKAKDAFYARHKKNLEGNPYFRAYARATWRDGGMIPEYPDGGILYPDGIGLDAIANAAVPIPQIDTNLNFTPSFVGAKPPMFGYTDKNITAFVNKAKQIRDKYKTLQGEDGTVPYGDQKDNQAFEDFETLKALYAKLPSNAKKEQANTFNIIEKSLYGDIKDRTTPGYLVQQQISNTGIDRFAPIVRKKPIAQRQNQNSPIEMPPSYPINRTVAPYMPMAGQTTMLPRVPQTQQEPIVNQTTPYQLSNIPSIEEIAALGQPAPPPLTPMQQMLGNVITGATNMAAQNQKASIENPRYSAYPGREEKIKVSPGAGPQEYNPISYETRLPNQFRMTDFTYENPGERRNIPSTSLTNFPENYIQNQEIPTPYEQEDAFQQQMIAAQQAAQGDTNIPYTPEYKPETPGPKEEPFKLRPLEYATIGLKGLALGKSIYDALQPAEKEQLRLNREAGLVNNMMAGRNVNMAAALNEALYNRNAALASNQARSANVQRALDMQTYSNAERNAIRAKLEEQNMNNQLRMQEAQTRAELGAAEAAERVRRQNVQSMNEAARRAFGQKAFQDLSTIGTELNKAQVYKDMYKNQRDIAERQYNEYLSFLQQSGGRFTVANLPYTDYLQGKIPQIVVNTEYQQPTPQEPKKPG